MQRNPAPAHLWRTVVLLLALLLGFPGLLFSGGHPATENHASAFGGYVQVRYETASESFGSFSVRRAKVWDAGAIRGTRGWRYKVQVLAASCKGASPKLLDAFLEYRRSGWKVRFGQMVPDFTLQRSQPDWRLPVLERADVVNVLHPGAETLCRDIGVALVATPRDGFVHASFGLFNGTGGNRLAGPGAHGMLTHRLFVEWRGRMLGRLRLGYSLMTRRATRLRFPKLLGSGVLFSGTDKRGGLEIGWQKGRFYGQAEFLEGRLGTRTARGAYGLATWRVSGSTWLVGYGQALRRPLETGTERRKASLGCVWQAPANRLRLWLFAEWASGGEPSLALRTQIQAMFN